MYTDHFLATLPEEFELHAFDDDDQPCPTGTFYEAGWAETCCRKVDIFLRACQECTGGTFFYSDVDVQFFGPIRDRLLLELGEHDIACQRDRDRHCSGFSSVARTIRRSECSRRCDRISPMTIRPR